MKGYDIIVCHYHHLNVVKENLRMSNEAYGMIEFYQLQYSKWCEIDVPFIQIKTLPNYI